jgi:hypothetical protein
MVIKGLFGFSPGVPCQIWQPKFWRGISPPSARPRFGVKMNWHASIGLGSPIIWRRTKQHENIKGAPIFW